MLQDPTGEAAGNAQKQLTLYELDLGLNHVTRKWSQEVDNGANLLVPVPGGADGPGGVLVCAENFIIYSNQVQLCISPYWVGAFLEADCKKLPVAIPWPSGGLTVVVCCCGGQDHADVRAVIPRRTSLLTDRGVLVVSYATHKQKSLFFFLMQVHAPP